MEEEVEVEVEVEVEIEVEEAREGRNTSREKQRNDIYITK